VQALIDSHPRRTTFCFANGTYRLARTIWTGDKFPRLDLRAGVVVDGQDGDFPGISGNGAPARKPGTIVLGGVFQHFGNANGASWAAPIILGRNWIVKGTTFKENFNSGVTITGDNARVSNVYVHHNGKYGISATHPCTECAGPKDVIIEDSEIAFNNTRRLDPSYDAGGTKFSGGTDGMIVRRNEVHHNYGSGVWFDGLNKNAKIYRNVVYDNYRWGIFWELSYGGTKIHHNTLTGNGIGDGTLNGHNAQLVVANSDGTVGGIEIHDNTIDGTAYPLTLIDAAHRGIRTKKVFVHHNVMIIRASTSRVGGFGTEPFIPAAHIRIDKNTYRVPDRRAAYWAWNGQTLTWSQWKAAGHDTDGTIRVLR
jgi:Right handed beta helix region